MISVIRSLACPSPYGLTAFAIPEYLSESSSSSPASLTISSSLIPATFTVPASTASGLSVSVHRTKTGFPQKGASSCLHDIQIVTFLDFKCLHDLAQHFSVLSHLYQHIIGQTDSDALPVCCITELISFASAVV